MNTLVLDRSEVAQHAERPAPPVTGTWLAPTGESVTLRPVRTTDLDLQRAFVRGLSPSTGYQRLMSPRVPSEQELRAWTDVDGSSHVALIALVIDEGILRQVGAARYVVDPDVPGQAEFAIVLSDDWQSRGLGRRLLGPLVELARERGLKRLVGTTLSENLGMQKLALKLGFRVRMSAGAAFITELTLVL